MEVYRSVDDTRNRHDEPYYRTPAFGPEDIICRGSDSEESPEQITQKRLRYERQARRYLRGHRPVLLSVSLRGPFSRESGWINPWSSSRRIEVQGGPRQGSRDDVPMRAGLLKSHTVPAREGKENDFLHVKSQKEDGLSARPLSLERESLTKLGYVNSAEGVDWQARVDGTRLDLEEESPSGHQSMQEHVYGDETRIELCTTLKAHSSVESEAKPADSMLNHHARTPSTNIKSDISRGVKRPRDSEWLKGSYVSKRARWDEPALSSPTPRPLSHPLRDRTRRAGDSLQQELNVQSKTFEAGSISNQSPQSNTLFSAQVEDRRRSHIDSSSIKSSFSPKISNCPRNIGHGVDDSRYQVRDLKSSLRKPSGNTFQRRSSSMKDRSSIHAGERGFTTTSPQSHTSKSPNPPGSSSRAKATSDTLPQLPRPKTHSPDPQEDSFVSEVAPSSRNLEQFHFKKRKRRTKYGEHSKSSDEEPQFQIMKYPPDEVSTNKGDAHVPSAMSSTRSIPKQSFPDEEPPKTDRPSEGSIFEVPEYAMDLEGGNQDESPMNMIHPGEDDHHTVDKDQFIEPPILIEQVQDDTPEPPTPQVLFPVDANLSVDNENGGSFSLGNMSFLRAVLRAGDPASEICSSPRDEASKSAKSLSARGKNHEEDGQLPYLPNLKFGMVQREPSSSNRNSPSVLLSSPEFTPSKSCTDIMGSQESVQSRTGQIFSPKLSPEIVHNSALLPILHAPLLEDNSSLSVENGTNVKTMAPTPASKVSRDHASSSAQQRLPENQRPESSKSCPDPNDFTTQSYNTTPFKSQRSAHRSQFLWKSPEAEALGDHEHPCAFEAEGTVMDRIQLELSQRCSSSPNAATPSEDDNIDIAESPRRSDFNVDRPHSSTYAIEPALPQGSGTQEELSEEAPGRTTHNEAGIIGIESGKRELCLEQLTAEQNAEHGLHVEVNNVDDNPTDDLNQLEDVGKEDSEASWEGCGPQSPWAIELIAPILTSVPGIDDVAKFGAVLSSPSRNVISLEAEQSDDRNVSSGWQLVEQPLDLPSVADESFEELPTITESSKSNEVATAVHLTNTQILDAATNNPWTASPEESAAVKVTKRVSFGKSSSSQSQDGEDSQPIEVKFGPASQSVQEHPDDEDDSIHTAPGKSLLSRRPASRRRFKKILPDTASSPAAVVGQAEAFIAADRETSIDQEPQTTSSAPKHLQTRSGMDGNLVWKHPDETHMLLRSYMRLDRSPSPQAHPPFEAFDMDEALGEAGKFLEDWSVDSELKKASHASDTHTSNESYGYRRRRLFGLV